jgi:hypothetical protein
MRRWGDGDRADIGFGIADFGWVALFSLTFKRKGDTFNAKVRLSTFNMQFAGCNFGYLKASQL